MIRISQIKINVKKNQTESIKRELIQLLKIKLSDIKSIQINKKSIDARHKPKIYYIYELDVDLENENDVLQNNQNVKMTPINNYIFKNNGTKILNHRPVIVGSGPAGLFCAYLLAQANYKPIIIERGQKVEQRIKSVDTFWTTGTLNVNSNVQFGEGGAGTFSDGKLNTLIKDSNYRHKKVFDIFIAAGAPKEIMYDNKPHIGTDLLRTVIINIRKKIIQMGGEFKYNTCLKDIQYNNNISKIKLNNKWMDVDLLVLALGNGARDTFEMLYNRNIQIESKPFALGIRIEHKQKMINYAQYGETYKYLPPASYKLTYKSKSGRGVYTFCMCPGGYVVNSSSEHDQLVINGMSNYKRDSENANSAIVVTVNQEDFGSNPLDGLKFQRKLEEKAYNDGKIPVQLYKDFKLNKISTHFHSIIPCIKGNYQFADVRNIFPSDISNSLIEAIEYFDTKVKGYACDDAIISGVESRTSSPIRIIRNDLGESNIKGIFPCGEGSGYSGGITSSAIDGIKTAEKIASIYTNFKEK